MSNQGENPASPVVAAAILVGDLVCMAPRPGRHHSVISGCAAAGMPTPIKGVQGFVDADGRFLTRIEAAHRVGTCGQSLRSGAINMAIGLFSEDLR